MKNILQQERKEIEVFVYNQRKAQRFFYTNNSAFTSGYSRCFFQHSFLLEPNGARVFWRNLFMGFLGFCCFVHSKQRIAFLFSKIPSMGFPMDRLGKPSWLGNEKPMGERKMRRICGGLTLQTKARGGYQEERRVGQWFRKPFFPWRHF